MLQVQKSTLILFHNPIMIAAILHGIVFHLCRYDTVVWTVKSQLGLLEITRNFAKSGHQWITRHPMARPQYNHEQTYNTMTLYNIYCLIIKMLLIKSSLSQCLSYILDSVYFLLATCQYSSCGKHGCKEGTSTTHHFQIHINIQSSSC